MQKSDNEAKRRLLANVCTNIMVVFVNGLIFLWLTPYLINHLGVEAYGMIPLATSFIQYFSIFTMSISNAVSRYVAIHLDRGELEKSNEYFNSAFFALLALCAIFLVPVIILSVFFSRLFQVPAGFETSVSWLFFYVMLSSFITSVTNPFWVSTFVTHRFDLLNLAKMLSQFLRIAIIVLCFAYLLPSLKYVGLSYCGMTLFVLVCSIVLTKLLTPELHLNHKLFRCDALRKMGRMSGWIAVNQVGSLLNIGVSFVIINLFLGPEQLGRYGPIALLVSLLGQLGWAISNVFTPIAFEYVARNKVDILSLQIRRSTKFLGLIMGFPTGLLCGLSTPILQRWLGHSFADLGPLVWLLIGPWLITISIMPMYSMYRGLDKVKTPAIVTLVFGIMNLLISILLVKYAGLGLYGVALSLLLCMGGKNLFFTPIYSAIITGQPKTTFIKGIIPGVVMASLISVIALALSRMYDLASIPRLLAVGMLMMVIYASLCYGVATNKEERVFLWSLIYRRR